MAARRITSPQSEQLPPLGQHRRRSGITLQHSSDSTKISLRFLRAIEEERFAELPGGIFARSYIRQYASAIGFDEEELLSRYQAQSSPSGGSASDLFPKNPSSEGPRRRPTFGLFRVLGSIRFL